MTSKIVTLLEKILNDHVRESTAARDRLAALEGKALAADLIGPGIAVTLSAEDGAFRVSLDASAEADATLRGTPLALLGALRGDSLSSFGTEYLSLSGDAQIAEEFAEVLRLARPDIEEQFSHVAGDIFAHKAANAVRDIRAWGTRAVDALLMNSSEFLQEESRQTPARVEVERFYADVDSLRDAAERVAVKVDRYLASAN